MRKKSRRDAAKKYLAAVEPGDVPQWNLAASRLEASIRSAAVNKVLDLLH